MARKTGVPNFIPAHIITMMKVWQRIVKSWVLRQGGLLQNVALNLPPGWRSTVTSSNSAVLAVAGPVLTSPPNTWSIAPTAPGTCTLTIGIQLDTSDPPFYTIAVSIEVTVI